MTDYSHLPASLQPRKHTGIPASLARRHTRAPSEQLPLPGYSSSLASAVMQPAPLAPRPEFDPLAAVYAAQQQQQQ